MNHQPKLHNIRVGYFQEFNIMWKGKNVCHQTLDFIRNVKLIKRNIDKKLEKEKKQLHEFLQLNDKKLS